MPPDSRLLTSQPGHLEPRETWKRKSLKWASEGRSSKLQKETILSLFVTASPPHEVLRLPHQSSHTHTSSALVSHCFHSLLPRANSPRTEQLKTATILFAHNFVGQGSRQGWTGQGWTGQGWTGQGWTGPLCSMRSWQGVSQEAAFRRQLD